MSHILVRNLYTYGIEEDWCDINQTNWLLMFLRQSIDIDEQRHMDKFLVERRVVTESTMLIEFIAMIRRECDDRISIPCPSNCIH